MLLEKKEYVLKTCLLLTIKFKKMCLIGNISKKIGVTQTLVDQLVELLIISLRRKTKENRSLMKEAEYYIWVKVIVNGVDNWISVV